MNAAQALVRRLIDHGVDAVFGLPGEENLAFVEALADSAIELVVTRHEQHAAFMAAAHGRLTRRPGVCLATLGPGAINLFTGLAHAELGGMPVIAITGQKPNRDNDEGSFQVVDIPAAARPLTRWSVAVSDPRAIVATIDEAFSRAMSDRPGAVLIELPEDVAEETMETAYWPLTDPVHSSVPASAAIAAAADVINRATRPVILVSAGATSVEVSRSLTAFAESTGIGVLATQLGKGAIPESHPLSNRSLGIHRPDYSHVAIEPADLVVAVGYQPVEHPPLAWNPEANKTIIHVASWRAAKERGYQPSHELVGGISGILELLGQQITPRDPAIASDVGSVISQLLDNEDGGEGFPPSPLAIVRAVQSAVNERDVVALDNGAYKIWFARHFRAEFPNRLLLDNALATMGAGLATGMAATRLANNERVLVVAGDGGFLMNVQDIETACRLELDLTILVVRDNAYGFIGWHQEEQGRDRDGVALANPDMALLAEAFGASACTVTKTDSLADMLERAMDTSGVSLIDCPIDYTMNALLSTDLYAHAREALARP
ncbi:MAG: acetolactate synthase large subunit [Acidimicrobiia bacterium]|nr:acetolactate synthase large subunit [Acidimicrobiia bacterium]